MGSLKENTSYQSNSFKPFMDKMIGAATKIGQSLPSKKSVNLAGFGNVVNAVKTGASKALGAVTTPFGGSTKYEGYHPGIDIANKMGTIVPDYASGRVTNVVTGHKQGDAGFGNYVEVTDSQGNKHRYSHLLNAYVQPGQYVSKGQPIGAMGNTGQTYSLSGGTGSHLDYRIVDIYGRYINPNQFINS